jgi:hypothetical protein
MEMLIVAMMAQRRIFMRPDISRKRVKANDVLLQTAARIEKVPVKLPMRLMLDMFSGATLPTCLPRPLDTLNVTSMIEVRSINFSVRC